MFCLLRSCRGLTSKDDRMKYLLACMSPPESKYQCPYHQTSTGLHLETKNLLHLVTLTTNLLHVGLFLEDSTQLEQKQSSPWCDLNQHWVSAMSIQYIFHFSVYHFYFLLSYFVACSRNLWTTQTTCNNNNNNNKVSVLQYCISQVSNMWLKKKLKLLIGW